MIRSSADADKPARRV